MSDDLPISDFADQLHDDLLVKRLTDSDNTGFSNDLEKEASVEEVPKTASGGFFYSLVSLLRKGGTEMFEKGRFVEDCRAALKERDTHAAIRELVATAVSEPTQIVRALGEPRRAGVETIYRADDLTILNLCWGPWMKF